MWWRLPALAFLASASVLYGETFAVLPFFNDSSDANLDWIGESVAENIREALLLQGAIAIPREDRNEAYRRLSLRPYAILTKASVLKIGEVLDADQVLLGHFELQPASVSSSRGTLRITAQLINRRNVKAGPEFLSLGALEDLAALQTHLAWQTLQFVMPKTAPSEEEFRRSRPPVRVDAMENYIRGLVATNDEIKHRFFTQAARLDPTYSQPCFQLGRMQFERKDYRVAREWLAKVSASDVHYRHATFLRGISLFYLADYAAAQEAFQLIANDLPLNEVWNNLGASLARRDDPGAQESFRKALEGDASDPTYHFNLGYALWKAGNFAEAAKSFQAVLDRDPEDREASLFLSKALSNSGPRPNDMSSVNRERLKHDFEESAFLQLRAILEGASKQ